MLTWVGRVISVHRWLGNLTQSGHLFSFFLIENFQRQNKLFVFGV